MKRYWKRPRPWLLGGGLAASLGLVAGCALRAAGRSPAAPQAAGHPPTSGRATPASGAAEALLHFNGIIRPADRGSYLGSAACARCHRAEAAQQETRHARTLARVDPRQEAPRFRSRDRLFNSADEIAYHTAVKNGGCLLEASDDGRTQEATADYAFGAGNSGRTYISHRNGQSIQLRFSYYGWVNRWDYTPGLRAHNQINSPLGQKLDQNTEASCFACHSTAIVRAGTKLDLNHSIIGIGCEACHGPGREHVEAVRRGERDLRMVRLSEVRGRVSLELCGRCHRGQLPPGLPPAAAAIKMARMQGYALSLSPCFRKGGVTCLTCHDPHHAAAEHDDGHYNAICAACHAPAQPAQHACPVQPRGDCVSCHMPEQDVGMPTGPRFRTHWIKTWVESPEAE